MAVVTLLHPKTINGIRYEALTLKRANGRVMRMLDREGIIGLMGEAKKRQEAGMDEAELLPPGLLDKMAPVFAVLAGVDESVIDELDGEDFMALFEKLEEVMPGSGGSPLSAGRNTTA